MNLSDAFPSGRASEDGLSRYLDSNACATMRRPTETGVIPPYASPHSYFSLKAAGLAVTLLASGNVAAQTVADDAVPEVVVTDQQDEPEGSADSGYRNKTGMLGPLGKASLKDIPYSVNVTSGALIENSNAHTLGDALKTNPTATLLMSPGGYTSMTRMMVRGFTAADQSEMRDGMVDRSFSFPPLENVDRIEVFNGFTGFLYGFSALGGSVNYVSKQPTEKPQASLSTGEYGGGIYFGHADVGGRVTSTDNRLGYRVNAYHEDGSTYVDDSTQKRTLVSAVIDYRLAPDTRLWTDLWHQNYDATGLQTYINPNPAAGIHVPDADKFDPTKQYGQSWTYNQAEKTLAGLGLDTKLNNTFSTRFGYRHGYMWRKYNVVEGVLSDNSGNYREYYTNTPRQFERTDSGYALLDTNVDTWSIHHDITAGYNGTRYFYIRGSDVPGSPGSTGLLLGSSNASSPTTYSDPNLSVGGKNSWGTSQNDNYLLGDRIKFNEQFSALIGVTRARQHSENWGTSNSTKEQTANTPSYALMFKPVPAVTTYVSYMEALVAGGTAPNTSGGHAVGNAGELLSASISKQYEMGVKATIGAVDVSSAVFRIEKVNEYTDPADYIYKQDGLQVHQGIELTGSGKLTERLTLVGGFSWLDAQYDKAKNNPALVGKTPINVPDWQGRAYLEYALPFVPDLTVTGGANYYGRRPVDALNSEYMDAATTFDAGLRYAPELYGHPVAVNLGITNILDTRYWAYYRDGEGLLLAQPRLLSLSAKVTW